MADLIYNRTAIFSRSTLVTDATNGSRMVPVVTASNVPCAIQSGRTRHAGSQAVPAGVQTINTNDMSAWVLITRQVLDVKQNDNVVDDLGRQWIVVTAYPTSFGSQVGLNPLQP